MVKYSCEICARQFQEGDGNICGEYACSMCVFKAFLALMKKLSYVDPPRTVVALIALLQTYPLDFKVETEGCDCEGPWSGKVYLSGYPMTVVVGRGR